MGHFSLKSIVFSLEVASESTSLKRFAVLNLLMSKAKVMWSIVLDWRLKTVVESC